METPVDNIQTNNPQQSFVNWFRNSSPYIHAHRHRTFVITFGGEALQDDFFANLIHDIALLNSLGIRLVLVHGIRPQIDERLQRLNIEPRFHHQIRITDDHALKCVKEAAGMVRVEIEALLSMGLANSPMSGAKIRVTSGNFVTAKPIGILDGIDHCHTGEVRRIDTNGIDYQLDQHNVVLVSPIGYSPSGEVFNLSAEQVATHIAIALKAEKLIFMTEQSYSVPQMTTAEAEAFLANNPALDPHLKNPLHAAIQGCLAGVERAHLINRNCDGALLIELFSRSGIGTLISATAFEELRQATLDDIGGILELITPLERQGKLVKRSRELLEMQIADYFVIEIDGLIIGCAALHAVPDSNIGQISCVAVHQRYQHGARGNHLLQSILERAKRNNIQQLYVLSTQTMHWFRERGFEPVPIASIPAALRQYYNPQRNSKALRITI